MKKLYLVLTSILVSQFVLAQTRTTIANGNATNPFTWDCTCVPIPGNNIVINHQLTLDSDFGYISGSITVNSGASITGNSPSRILGSGGTGSFVNNGTVTVANMYHQGGTFTNNGTMNVANAFASDQSAITVNNGTVNISDTLYINTNAQFTNNANLNATVSLNAGHLHNDGMYSGTDIWSSGMLMHMSGNMTLSNLYTSGMVTTNAPMSVSNDFWNSENVDINHDLVIGGSLYNGDTLGGPAVFTNDGLISIGVDYANSKTVNGTGRFCIAGTTTNSGTMSGTFDFCDQTGGAIDFNSGTVAGTITYCATACNIGVEEVEKNDVMIFPNPFENLFEIRASHAANYRIQLVNAIGQVLLDKTYTGNRIQLDASYLPGGIYFYKLSNADSLVSTGRLIKR